MKYRPDIDGLRAIAILLVLIYHGGLSLFPSGFIGVDVFFVISGFLITGIIHGSLLHNNFSFIDFYNRRLWRLQPVLICFIFSTLLLTLLLFLPEDLIQYNRSARKTSLFISNLFFNQTTTGYFSPDTHQLPLLHTWSLSIEWQCYLFLPLAIYGLHRILGLRTFILIMYVGTIACFLLALYYSKILPTQTYYQFSSRIFEFLVGGCIALLSKHPLPKNKVIGLSRWTQKGLFLRRSALLLNKNLPNLSSGLAMLSIFYIASLDHILIGYPNGYALIVCGATGFLIAIGRFYPTAMVVRFLSTPPLVFIGVISYSLYLWHWLVFSVLRYQGFVETPLVLLTAYGITFFLAFISWNFIEKPTRSLKRLQFRYTVIILLLFPITLIHAIDYFVKSNAGFPQRFNQELVTIYQQLEQYNSVQRPLCISNNTIDVESQCKIGTRNTDSRKGLMIGDSFSNHYWGFIDTLAKATNLTVLTQGVSSCITLPGIYLYDWWYFKGKIYQECRDQTEKYYRMIRENHYDYVFIGQIWTNYLSESVINHLGDKRSLELSKQRIEVALDQALEIIIESGAKPVLIKSTAVTKANMHDCFLKHIKLRQPYDPEDCSFQWSLSPDEQWFDSLFDRMKNKYSKLIVIDPKKVQCQNNQCRADLNGIPTFRDIGHITDYASYQFGSLYLRQFGNPL